MVQRPLVPGQIVQRQTLPIRKPLPGGKPGAPATLIGVDARGAAVPQREKRKFESLK